MGRNFIKTSTITLIVTDIPRRVKQEKRSEQLAGCQQATVS